MKLKFSHLYFENFMSFKQAEVDLSHPGFALVMGENLNPDDGASSNGSGKSTIFEAIYWCLTGTTIRGSKDVVNKQFEADGCYVELQFYAANKFVELLRSKNHNKYKTNLIIHVDGQDISAKGIRDSEKVFATTFPEISSDLIGSVIILGQGLPNRFTSNTPSGRKQILEQLTNSDFMIESLKTRISSREQELKSEITQLNLNVSLLNGKKSAIKSQIDSLVAKKESSNREELQSQFDVENANWINLSTQINTEVETIAQAKSNLAEIYKKVSDQKEANNSLISYRTVEIQNVEQKYNPKVVEVNSEISSLSSYITKAESIKDVCPTCGQKLVGVEKIDCSEEKHKLVLAKENKTRIHTERQNEIDAITDQYKGKIEEGNKLLSNYQQAYSDLDKGIKLLESQFTSDQQSERMLKSKLNNLEAQLKAIDLVDYDSQIKKAQEDLTQIDENLLYTNNELEDLTKHLEVISKFQTFIKRDFRGYLLDQYITFLNRTAKRYSTSLFGSDKVLISLDGNNLSISFADKEYESLSGGEKQKVDLLVQFSIREMLRSTLNFSSNILVLDEITDNLDAEGCQKLIDFISNSFTDLEGIYLISHRKDLDIPYDYMIHIVKDIDGISSLN